MRQHLSLVQFVFNLPGVYPDYQKLKPYQIMEMYIINIAHYSWKVVFQMFGA